MAPQESRIMEEILENKRSRIAVVGASPKKERPVFVVMSYLLHEEYQLYPVNPAHRGESLLGLSYVASLKDLPSSDLDVVALFLAAPRQESVLEDLLQLGTFPVVWFQPGAENPEAEEMLRSKGFTVFSGYCLMAERRARRKRKKS
ncbi:MAG TPA: CoA-binding protein [Synergistaceae bacterium]|nr:CoA-binding protein [Synergistaceae bacterium]HPJ24886.1 CoA-binding protein [Synergistaceae bacterium]HPQ37109.1 CoA-binding protein [Synergistaceae bacterium]